MRNKGDEYRKYDHETVAAIIARHPVSMMELVRETGYPKTAIRGIITELTYSSLIWEESNQTTTVFGMMAR